MTRQQKTQTRNYMLRLLQSGEHQECGEAELTALAEDAACALNLYVGDDIPEEVFDLAYAVGTAWERTQ